MLTERITNICNDVQGIWSNLWFSVQMKEDNQRLILNLLITFQNSSAWYGAKKNWQGKQFFRKGAPDLC